MVGREATVDPHATVKREEIISHAHRLQERQRYLLGSPAAHKAARVCDIMEDEQERLM